LWAWLTVTAKRWHIATLENITKFWKQASLKACDTMQIALNIGEQTFLK